jgi:serine/threonine protein kinase
MPTQALPAGYAVHEYRVEKLLGVGGFGLTYLALDANLNLRVALKEYLPGEIALRGPDQSITPTSSDTAEDFNWGKRRFLDESRTLASFRHPNIVRVMRFFEANGTAYMVMEYVEGDALPDWLKPRRPLAEAQVAALVGPLLDGLDVVHSARYMHRDIKPGNIYIRSDGSPVLLDFGSARQQNQELTAIVTPGYAPFEQYHTQGKQGPWSDLYALAGVLYWMVTGNRPIDAAARVRQDSLPPAVQAADRTRYRPEFLAAIDWALAPHEDHRPQNVREWRQALLGSPAAGPRTEKLPALQERQAFEAGFLKQVEGQLAQHLGPIAPVMVRNAAKMAQSPADLVHILAADITHDGTRAKFEKHFADTSRPVSQPPSGGRPKLTEPATAGAVSRFSPEVLARAERRLAPYLGAVSRVLVKRAAMKARDQSELYLLLADEIENPAEKKTFIRRALSASGKP